MPLITNKPRIMGDGTKITTYTDSVGPAFVTYTMEKEQESFTIYNKGLQPIVYTVGATSNVTVNPGQSSTVSANFTSFQVKSTSGVQQFLVETDESGDEFEDVKVKKLSDRIGVLLGDLETTNAQLAENATILGSNMTSPDGTKWKLTVDNYGNLSVVKREV